MSKYSKKLPAIHFQQDQYQKQFLQSIINNPSRCDISQNLRIQNHSALSKG